MTVREQVAALYELQQIDERIAHQERELAGLDPGESQRAVAEAAQREVEAARQRLHSDDREMLDAELEMKTVEEKRKAYEEKMYGGLIRNPKELQDMEREVEEQLKPQIDKLETKILQLMEDIEKQRAALAAWQNTWERGRAEVERVTQAHGSASAELTSELQGLRAQRERCAAAVPGDLLRRYEELRSKKGGVAVVNVLADGLCTGCRVALPADQARFLRREERVFSCENCSRILFWAGPPGD